MDSFQKQKGSSGTLFYQVELESLQICHDMPLPEELAIEREDIRKIYVCLKRYTVDQQLVIMLRFIRSLSLFETAKALGWTEGKVRDTQHRAIKKLKELFPRKQTGANKE